MVKSPRLTPDPPSSRAATATTNKSDPVKAFSSLALSPALQAVIQELGFQEMTPIQAQSLPLLLAGLDVIAQAQTGSGKTLAFSAALLQTVKVKTKAMQALVLCPTRELAGQVLSEIRKLGRKIPDLQVLGLSGGVPMGPQVQALKRGVHITVGTPGRVLDHLMRKSLVLDQLQTWVLDEADRILEMGFQKELEAIHRYLPEKRQTLFFSATFPATIQELSQTYQHQPHFVRSQHPSPAKLAGRDSGHARDSDADGSKDTHDASPETAGPEGAVNDQIRQSYYLTPPAQKLAALVWLIEKYPHTSILIFCNFKASVTQLVADLSALQISVAGLQGDLDQAQRDRILVLFRHQSVRVLVATDVAARGLDVAHLGLVINFEFPKQWESYVHRIGRTGRAGKKGMAVSLVHPQESGRVNSLEKRLSCQIAAKTLPEDSALQAASHTPQPALMNTLCFAAGRKDKLRPGDLLGALTGEAGRLEGAWVGNIEIHDHVSFVAISSQMRGTIYDLLTRLKMGQIKGKKIRVSLLSPPLTVLSKRRIRD